MTTYAARLPDPKPEELYDHIIDLHGTPTTRNIATLAHHHLLAHARGDFIRGMHIHNGSKISDPNPARECCGMSMNTLEIFGIRIYQCYHRSHHPMIFHNLNTGEVFAESYSEEDGGLKWTSHYEGEE
jgi:hypothetical protein